MICQVLLSVFKQSSIGNTETELVIMRFGPLALCWIHPGFPVGIKTGGPIGEVQLGITREFPGNYG